MYLISTLESISYSYGKNKCINKLSTFVETLNILAAQGEGTTTILTSEKKNN